ncbi:hypothetical protein MKW92_050468, partial [Papaver armeniacum]
VVVASARVLTASGVGIDENRRFMALDCIDERRDKADAHAATYRDRLARSYNQKVIPRSFEVGDLVLSIAPHVPRNESA